MCKKKEKTPYPYSEEQCKKLDDLLLKMLQSREYYATDSNLNIEESAFANILHQYGLVERKVDTGRHLYTPILPDAGRFYRTGGFDGERLKKLQEIKHRKLDIKLRVYSILASVLGGGLMGAIVSIVFKWLSKNPS